MTNIDRQRSLDRKKWLLSEKEGKDYSGFCDYCDFCKHLTEEKKCNATQEEREQHTLCARAYNKMKKSRN